MGNFRTVRRVGLAGVVCAGLSCSCQRATPGGSPATIALDPQAAGEPIGAAARERAATTPPEGDGSVDEDAGAAPPLVLSPDALAAVRRFFDLEDSIADEPTTEINDAERGYDIRFSARYRMIMPQVKRAFREAVRRILGDTSLSALSDDALSDGIAGAFEAVRERPWSSEIHVRRQPEHPERLAVVVSFPVPFGADGSVYVFETHAGAEAALVMAIETKGYTSFTEAQWALSFAISPPDEHGRYFVVEAHTAPWITSNWRGVHYRAFEPTGSADAPKVLLEGVEEAFLDDRDQIASVTAERDAFEVSFFSQWAHDTNGDSSRAHVRHYVRSGAGFARAQPIVSEASHLPDEWMRLPWPEAARWTKSPVSLERWHARLTDPRSRSGTFRYEVVADAGEHVTVRVHIECSRCADGGRAPQDLLFDVVRDGPGYALASIEESP